MVCNAATICKQLFADTMQPIHGETQHLEELVKQRAGQSGGTGAAAESLLQHGRARALVAAGNERTRQEQVRMSDEHPCNRRDFFEAMPTHFQSKLRCDSGDKAHECSQ